MAAINCTPFTGANARVRTFLSLAALAVATVLAVAATARADVTDILREIQRNGSARVVITMKTGGTAGVTWRRGQVAEQQRHAVASVRTVMRDRLHAAAIPVTVPAA